LSFYSIKAVTKDNIDIILTNPRFPQVYKQHQLAVKIPDKDLRIERPKRNSLRLTNRIEQQYEKTR